MENKADYLDYVKMSLNSIDLSNVSNVYSTGYGLSLVTGDDLKGVNSCHAMDLLGRVILKIRPPRMAGPEWDKAWAEGVALVNKAVRK